MESINWPGCKCACGLQRLTTNNDLQQSAQDDSNTQQMVLIYAPACHGSLLIQCNLCIEFSKDKFDQRILQKKIASIFNCTAHRLHRANFTATREMRAECKFSKDRSA